MAFLVINLSERGRNNLGRLGAVVSLLLVLLGLSIVGMALFIRSRIQAKLQLLENYNGAGFIYFLLVSGVMVALVYAVGVKIFLDLAFYDTRYRWEDKTRLYGLIIAVIVLIILSCIIVVFTHQITMRKYFETGLKTAMDRYSKSLEIKRTIDEMQLEFQCCGSKEPQDWFTVPWIGTAYLDLKDTKIKHALQDGVYKGDHVPFSCCSGKAVRPCIHRFVKTGSHAGYTWPKDSTLSSTGCAVALAAEFLKTTLNVAGYVVIVTFIIMLISLFMLKLMSTAVANTYPWGDPEGEAPTWLLETCPIGMCDGETPEPPDDLPVVMPGAKLPAHKVKTKPSETDMDDVDSVEGDTVPLLKHTSKPDSAPVVSPVKNKSQPKPQTAVKVHHSKSTGSDSSPDDTDNDHPLLIVISDDENENTSGGGGGGGGEVGGDAGKKDKDAKDKGKSDNKDKARGNNPDKKDKSGKGVGKDQDDKSRGNKKSKSKTKRKGKSKSKSKKRPKKKKKSKKRK